MQELFLRSYNNQDTYMSDNNCILQYRKELPFKCHLVKPNLAVFYYFLAPSWLGLTVGMWRNSAAKDEGAVD